LREEVSRTLVWSLEEEQKWWPLLPCLTHEIEVPRFCFGKEMMSLWPTASDKLN